ncbi:hypothetical protein CNMCM8980_004612 [Aspergillus fumigatiaffinis]|nr:hypothetical protein CNMCM8980_004612 [Aspergillus fumigatiaffinis]
MASSTGSIRIQAKSETHSTAEVVELLPRPTSLDAPATQAHMFPQLHISPAGRQKHPYFPDYNHEYSDTSRYWKQHHAFNHLASRSIVEPHDSWQRHVYSTSATAAPSSPTNNEGHMLDGSLIAVAGAAIGAVALI